MCPLCFNIITDDKELNRWLRKGSYDDSTPYNIIYKDLINFYLYSKVSDYYYNEDTRTLINYCPVCGEKLEDIL